MQARMGDRAQRSPTPPPGPKRRIGWVDAARGIGIVLVVYGHAERGLVAADIYPATSSILLQDELIYAFHMPLFFLLSGLFAGRSAERGAGPFLRSRLTSIIYPYFLWSILQVSLNIAAGSLVNTPDAWATLVRIAWVPTGQLWFLYALLLCQLPLLLPRRLFYLAIPIAIAAKLVWGGNILTESCAEFPFFAAGVWLTAARTTDLLASRNRAFCGALLAWAAFAALFALEQHLPHGRSSQMVGIAVAAAGIAGTLAIARLVAPFAEVLLALGTASMPIYLAHVIASAAVRIALSRAWPDIPPIFLLIVVTLAGLALPYLLYLFARRHGMTLWLGFGHAPARSRVDAAPLTAAS